MILFYLVWLALSRPVVTVTPSVIFAGGTVRVTCRVPRDARNRSVTLGLDPVTSSAHQLDGEDSRVTWDLLVTHVPCEAERAFCVVTQVNPAGRITLETPLIVAGCDGQEK